MEVLEAVPNFSEGRDLAKVRALVETIAGYDVDVLDWSADPDHHRSVVTYIGPPAAVEEASLGAARFAMEHIDLRAHRGVHPRVGALDVLPFVPLHGLEMPDAVASAHRVGRRLGEMGLPVYYYGFASDPEGRSLAELRRGGFEALQDGWPADRPPDVAPHGWEEPPHESGFSVSRRPHPTAGVTCVGAREVLLAWNVFVGGVDVGQARRIASLIRERDGGFAGLRALGLQLQGQNRIQVSMNLEDPHRTSPLAVFERIEAEVRSVGGYVEETEVIGMMPDTLVLPGTADRLELADPGSARVLSHRLAEHLSARGGGRPETSEITE